MPSSAWTQIDDVISLIKRVNPMSMLDVGVGFGKYGVLAREYLELWDGRDRYDDWRRRIDGIEVFEEYHNPIYDWAYDAVFFGNALEVIEKLDNYDLILMVDVIEHFEKEDGARFLRLCSARSKNILVVTPIRPSAQKSAFGNPHEEHRSAWTQEDLKPYGRLTAVPNRKSLVCLLSRKEND